MTETATELTTYEPRRRYAPGYRAPELQQIAGWIRAGASGSIVGLPGTGKSNLFAFVAQDEEWMRAYFGSGAHRKVVVVSVDLNSLADGQFSTLYRLILRGLFDARHRFGPQMAPAVEALFADHKYANDFFVLQSAVQDLLHLSRPHIWRVVLLLDQFDTFCKTAVSPISNALRALRDSHKEALCYIVGLQRPLYVLSSPAAFGDLYGLLDLHTLWLGPMNLADSMQMAAQEAARFGRSLPERSDMERLWRLSGGFPAVLKAVCCWRLWQKGASVAECPDALLAQPAVRFRLQELWRGLEQEEQAVLFAVANGRLPDGRLAEADVIERLVQKGVCCWADGKLQVAGELFSRYVQTVSAPGYGRVWLNSATGEIFQGDKITDLPPLAHAVLTYLLRHPRTRRTKTNIIEHVWPENSLREGITDDSLYQVAAAIRKAIEPDPARPRYLLTWRGQPEGGYQLFPEGRPE